MRSNSFTDKGIIIRRFPVSEFDMLLIIFSQYHGKIKATARGVRKITSRRSGHVDLFNVINFQVNKKGDWLTLNEASVEKSFDDFKKSKDLMVEVYHIAELINILLADDDKQSQVFDKTLDILGKINSAGGNELNSRLLSQIRDYEIDLLRLLGYWSDDMYGVDYPTDVDKRKDYHMRIIEEIAEREFKSYKTLGG